MSETNVSNGGIGLPGLLFAIFLTLNLVGIDPIASWSWWWVVGR